MATIRLASETDAAVSSGYLRAVLQRYRHLVRRGSADRAADGPADRHHRRHAPVDRARRRWGDRRVRCMRRRITSARHIGGRSARRFTSAACITGGEPDGRCIRRCSNCCGISGITRRRPVSPCRIPRVWDCTKPLDSRWLACIVTSDTRWAAGTTSRGIRQPMQPAPAHPTDPRPIGALHGSAEWHDAVARGVARYVQHA